MTELAERIKTEMLGLPAKERAELAYYLIRTLDPPDDADEDWGDELDRRYEEMVTGQAPALPAAEVFDELYRKHTQT